MLHGELADALARAAQAEAENARQKGWLDEIAHAIPDKFGGGNMPAMVREMAAESARLRAIACDALSFAEEGWCYASDYFREKWSCNERKTLLRKMLGFGPNAPLPEMTNEQMNDALRAALTEPEGAGRG